MTNPTTRIRRAAADMNVPIGKDGADLSHMIRTDSAGRLEIVLASGLGALKRMIFFTINGVPLVGLYQVRLPNETGSNITIEKVVLHVNTAPTGQALIVDIHKNGTTIYTTQANRPQVAAAAYRGASVPDVTAWADQEYLQVHVDQLGSTAPGVDLTVCIVCG